MKAPTWFRWAAALLALPQAGTGAWAALAPRHWYDTFPGFGPLLVASEPPYNAHLATDAGAGFLATGVILLVAAWLGGWSHLRLALGAYVVFAAAHLLFHAFNPAPGLDDRANAVNLVVLVLASTVPALLLWIARPGRQIS
jgi:hypothetical protein